VSDVPPPHRPRPRHNHLTTREPHAVKAARVGSRAGHPEKDPGTQCQNTSPGGQGLGKVVGRAVGGWGVDAAWAAMVI
jgi:hypothetical protein